MRRLALWLLLFGILLPDYGCAPNRTVRGTGAVHRFTTGGGFWAIRDGEGTTYDPVRGSVA